VTFPATANVVEHVGAKPVFIDVNEYDLNMNSMELRNVITNKTRAIIPVNLYGGTCDLEGVRILADLNKESNGGHKIAIIQDNAHAVESRYKGRSLAWFSDYSCYSFYATKNMTTAEGGMLIVDSEEKRQRAEMLCLHGLSKDAWKRYQATGYQLWDLEFPGFKYNMTDIAAAMGIWQLRRIDENWKRRAAIVAKYREELSGFKGIKLLCDDRTILGHKHAHHLFPIIFDGEENDKIKNKSQEQIIREIEGRGVGVGVHFPCLPLTKYYREKYGYRKENFPVASKMTEKIVSIPLYPGLRDWEVNKVIDAVKSVV
jgi:dTDP-4-amino-4,6-dideoxygalactose transaminase